MRDEHRKRERLTVFSRIPLAGRSKTRLAVGVGTQQAARFHHEMSLRCLTTATRLQHRRDEVDAYLAIADTPQQAKQFFGTQLKTETQSGGDLGERMAACFDAGRRGGVERHVIIGTDAPALTPDLLHDAFEALKDNDLVLGPARDGGYYLIGLAVDPPPILFNNMPWGSPEVLSLTLSRASDTGLSLRLLPALDDVDRPDDLPVWRRRRHRWPPLNSEDGVSVIIPVLNEAEQIAHRVRELLSEGSEEVIVVDGGSQDESVREAESAGARVLSSDPGRGVQMNTGARAARYPALLFLHADTRLGNRWRQELFSSLSDSRTVGGAFRFQLDGRGWRYRLSEWMVALRCRLLRRPYGDQGLFCRSETFLRLGGYPEVALMEDFLFVKALRRQGRLRLLKTPAISSPRNWERAGFWRVFWTHQLVLAGYYLGIPLNRLARWRQRRLRG